jgi:hypothetical protein
MTDPSDQPFNSDPSAVQPSYRGASEARDPVPCPFCSQSFVMRIDMEAHMLAVHGVADKTKIKKQKTTRRRAHYNPTSQATSFRGAFIAFAAVFIFAVVVIGIANPGALKVLVPAAVIILVAVYFGLVRH